MLAAVDVGVALGAEVVVEGIETEEQLGLLRRTRCEVGQGYLFGRTMDAGSMEALLCSTSKP